MSRSIDQIQNVLLPFKMIIHLNGMALDRDPTLPFEVHIIEYLRQCSLRVINMRYNTEIADVFHESILDL